MTAPAAGLPLDQQPGPVVERMNLWAEARGEGPLGMAALAFRRAIVPIDSHAWSDWVRQIGRRVRSG